jgi:hypothetical protein
VDHLRYLIAAPLLYSCLSCDARPTWSSQDAEELESFQWVVRRVPAGLDLDYRSKVYQIGSGSVLIAPTAHPAQFIIASSRKTVSAEPQGHGPGELSAITAAGSFGDRLYIADVTGKIEVFRAADGQYVSQIRTPGLVDALAVRGDDTIAVAGPRAGMRPGAMVRWLNSTGEEIMPGQLLDYGLAGRSVFAAGRFRFFAVTPDYQIHEWTTANAMSRVFARTMRRMPGQEKYLSYVKDAAVDQNMLWVLISRRDTTQQARSPVAGPDEQPRMVDPADVSRLHQYIVELVDIDRGMVMARSWIDEGVVGGFIAPGCLYMLDQTLAGEVSLVFLHSTITPKEGTSCDEFFS